MALLHHLHAQRTQETSPATCAGLALSTSSTHPEQRTFAPPVRYSFDFSDVLRVRRPYPFERRAPHPTIDLPHPPKARSTPSLLTLTFRHPNTHTHLHTRSCRTCKAAKFKQGSTRCAAASCDKILKKINIGTRTKAERDYQVRRRGQELPRAYIYLACTTCPCELMGWVASV